MQGTWCLTHFCSQLHMNWRVYLDHERSCLSFISTCFLGVTLVLQLLICYIIRNASAFSSQRLGDFNFKSFSPSGSRMNWKAVCMFVDSAGQWFSAWAAHGTHRELSAQALDWDFESFLGSSVQPG